MRKQDVEVQMEGTAFRHERRLELATTPNSYWYTDPRVLEIEQARIFSRTWQLVGREEQVDVPGAYFTASIVDEPVVVVRGKDGVVRAFSNVCRHRAGPVATGSGRRMSLQCAYHGWTYALDGQLLGTPETEGMECFAKQANGLPELRVEPWNGLVFVNIDPYAAPLARTLEDLPEQIVGRDLARYRFFARKEWEVACNWKVYIDNYLEGYHIPLVHPGLNRELDYGKYRVETRSMYSIQHSPIRRVENGRIGVPVEGEANEAKYLWIFPNLMLNVYPDNYSTNLIVPLGPDRTLTIFEWFALDPEAAATREALDRSIAFSDEIQIEDIAICEAVQRGLRSAMYSSGRYSVARENGVHHFHSLLAEFLNRE